MSGIEIAGLVLGAFPIMLKCLEEYRRGFEPLDEWWHFHTRFIEFVDDIRHQMMLFHGNMMRLLDPIISNNDDLFQLAANGKDSRWKDGSLAQALRKRLASELDRLVRVIHRMHQIVEQLESLLQIKDGQVSWLGAGVENPPWQWHFNRMRLAFDKRKHRKVRKLGEHNQELKQILGFGEEMLVVTSRRGTSSDSVQRLDRVRQDALVLFNALSRTWSCGGCQERQANLKLRHDASISELEMLLVVSSETRDTSSCSSRSHRISVRRDLQKAPAPDTDIRDVPQAATLSNMQKMTEDQLAHRNDRPSLQERVSSKIKGKGLMLVSAMKKSRGASSAFHASKSFSSSSSFMVIESHDTKRFEADRRGGPSIPMQTLSISTTPPSNVVACSIQSLCTFLGDSSSVKGTLSDEFDRLFELTKKPKIREEGHVTRLSLHEMLEAYQKQSPSLQLPRPLRFQMAAHIASALLQTNQSPWLLDNWSKHSFYFLVNPVTRKVESSHAFVSRSFPADSPDFDARLSEEAVYQCLHGVGIMIMELVYGCNIEDSSCYTRRCGKDVANHQALLASARIWQENLISESGPEVASAVFRCLYDGGFGQKACLSSSSFRKAVYEYVVEPLANYKDNWVVEPED